MTRRSVVARLLKHAVEPHGPWCLDRAFASIQGVHRYILAAMLMVLHAARSISVGKQRTACLRSRVVILRAYAGCGGAALR